MADAAPAAETLTGPALHEAKRAMRTQIIAARDALPDEERAASSGLIAERVHALASFRDARCVLLTLPFRSEWDTRPLFAAALADGKTVVLPRVNGTTRMLALHAIEDVVQDTAPGYRGIPEPRESLPMIAIEQVDWVLVPGVAFDPQGSRLGYGGGYYDRLLAMLAGTTPRLAGAFDVQVVPQVPAAPHDLVVEGVVTESRMYRIAKSA